MSARRQADQALVSDQAAARLDPAGFDPSREKGGFEQADWMRRYANEFERIGWGPYAAECAALNAWEASACDADPVETAEADMAYAAEDAE